MGLLAHVLVSRYCECQSLRRQAVSYSHDRFDLDCSTLAGFDADGAAATTTRTVITIVLMNYL